MERRDFLARLAALVAIPTLSRFAKGDEAARRMVDGYEAAELTAARVQASYSATGLPEVHTLLRAAGFDAAEIPSSDCWAYRIEDADGLTFEYT